MAPIAAALAIAAPNAAAAAPAVPMLDCSGLPCADVRVAGGKVLRLSIDTGDNRSFLDLGVARTLGLALAPFVGRDGKAVAGVSMATLPDVRLGDERLGDLKVMVDDLATVTAQGAFPQSQGTISYADLKGRRLVLDYRRRAISAALSTSPPACGPRCGVITYPTFGRQGPPIVVTTGFRVNGEPVTVQVDTLYAGTMLIYAASVARLGLTSQSTAGRIRNFPLTDGGVDMVEGRAKTESFGPVPLLTDAPLYFATEKVHQPDGLFDGTVGAELFKDHVVTLDFAADRFWIE